MIYHVLKVSVLSACLSQAFLLPPSLSTDEANLIESLVTQDLGPAERWQVEMDYPVIPEDLNLMTDMSPNQLKSILELNFTIQQHEDTDQLMLNELPIYPFISRAQDIIEPLTVPHRIQNEDKTLQYATLADLGYLVSALPNKQNPGLQEVEEIAIKVDFFKVTDQLFDKLQSIDLQLLSKPSGKLMIQLPQIDVSKPQKTNNFDPNKKCTSFLCKAEKQLYNVFRKAKGALKPCHMAAHLHDNHGHQNSTHHKSQPHHNHDHSTHHPHSNEHQSIQIQHKKDNFFFNVILPFLGPEIMAILIGATAALGSMLIGYIAIYTWTFLRRRRVNNYFIVRQSDIEDTEDDMSCEFLPADEMSEKIDQ